MEHFLSFAKESKNSYGSIRDEYPRFKKEMLKEFPDIKNPIYVVKIEKNRSNEYFFIDSEKAHDRLKREPIKAVYCIDLDKSYVPLKYTGLAPSYNTKEKEQLWKDKTAKFVEDFKNKINESNNYFEAQKKELIDTINGITKNDPYLCSYFERKLYEELGEILPKPLNLKQDKNLLDDDKSICCCFCGERAFPTVFSSGLPEDQNYTLCEKCEVFLSDYYPHNFYKMRPQPQPQEQEEKKEDKDKSAK